MLDHAGIEVRELGTALVSFRIKPPAFDPLVALDLDADTGSGQAGFVARSFLAVSGCPLWIDHHHPAIALPDDYGPL